MVWVPSVLAAGLVEWCCGYRGDRGMTYYLFPYSIEIVCRVGCLQKRGQSTDDEHWRTIDGTRAISVDVRLVNPEKR